MHTPISTQLNISRKGVCGSVQISRVLFLSSLLFSAVNSSHLVFLDSQLCLLNSENPLASAWVPSPYAVAWKTLKVVIWVIQRAHLICFPSLRQHYPLLQTIISYVLSVFWFYGWKGKSSSCYSVLVKSPSTYMKF